jgi:hypothetical protein
VLINRSGYEWNPFEEIKRNGTLDHIEPLHDGRSKLFRYYPSDVIESKHSTPAAAARISTTNVDGHRTTRVPVDTRHTCQVVALVLWPYPSPLVH